MCSLGQKSTSWVKNEAPWLVSFLPERIKTFCQFLPDQIFPTADIQTGFLGVALKRGLRFQDLEKIIQKLNKKKFVGSCGGKEVRVTVSWSWGPVFESHLVLGLSFSFSLLCNVLKTVQINVFLEKNGCLSVPCVTKQAWDVHNWKHIN